MTNDLPASRLARRLRLGSLVVALFSAAVGVLGLAGGVCQNPLWKAILGGAVPIEPNTACCFVLLGGALWWRVSREGPSAGIVARLLAGLAAAIGALSLAESLFGWDLGIDQLLFLKAPETAFGAARLGLMSPTVALGLVFLGSALAGSGRAAGRGSRFVAALAYAAGILAIFGLLDFVLRSEALHAPIALRTSVTLFALACGALTMRPDRGLAVLLASESLGGVLARRLFPAAVVTPIVLGCLFWSGFQAELFLPWTGIRLMIVMAVALLGGLTAWTAFVIHGIEIKTTEQRRRSEEALRRSEKHYSAILERASDIVTVVDEGGTIRYESPSVERVIGWTPGQLVGQDALSLIHPDDREAMAKVFQEQIADFGATVTTTYRSRHKDGSWRTLESVACNLRNDPDIQGVVLNTRDITERKSLEAQFLQSQKMEVAGQLAGGIAHDFNNILGVIMIHAELIRGARLLPTDVRMSVKDIQAAANHASGLVRQLLVFSRREHIQLRPLDLNVVLADLVKLLGKFLGEQIQLELKVQRAPAWIEADTGMIEQVVMNLCVNARDAMPQGGRLTIQVEPVEFNPASAKEPGRAGRFLAMTVTDAGHGMDEATLKRIFKPFFTTKEIGKGTGLGLATVYGIVKQHNGWIDVTSAVGQGTRFCTYFPASAPPPLVSAAGQPEEAPGGTETILLVEDEAAVRKATAQLLRRSGYRVVEAIHGPDALVRWDEQQGWVDLLLTDMVMPERMSGLEIAEKLLQRKRDLKVIIWSGYTVDAERLRLVARRGMDYLNKPVAPTVLLRNIRRCLDQT